MSVRASIVAVALVTGLVGCKSAKADGGKRTGLVGALHNAVTPAAPTELPIRFNPAPCECPPFEALHSGRWMRAFVDGDPEAVAPVEALRTSDPLAVARVTARVESRPRLADNGVRYAVIVID